MNWALEAVRLVGGRGCQHRLCDQLHFFFQKRGVLVPGAPWFCVLRHLQGTAHAGAGLSVCASFFKKSFY